jgi:hypothetical protein
MVPLVVLPYFSMFTITLLLVQAHAVGRGVDDAQIGLVRDQPSDVVRREAVASP